MSNNIHGRETVMYYIARTSLYMFSNKIDSISKLINYNNDSTKNFNFKETAS